MAMLDPRPTPKARRTRERILDCAVKLFRDRGFDPTSMRDVAAAAGMSVGSTYYHFSGKNALILAWYERTQEAAEEHCRRTCAETSKFAERLDAILKFKLEQLGEARKLVVVLSRNAADAGNPLSPFSPETRRVRDEAIALFEMALEGSDLAVDEALRPQLPRLLWMYQMGTIFFWTHDRSAGRRTTTLLIDKSRSILLSLLRLSTLPIPGMGKLRGQFLDLLEIFEG